MRKLYYGMLAMFQKEYLQKTQRRLRVLAYHSVDDPALFEEQMVYLKKNFKIIDVALLEQYLEQKKRLPSRALLLTFDDGELSVLDKGLPVLKKYKIPAVLFIISQLIGSNRAFWWKELEYYLGKEEGTKKVWEVKKWKNKIRLNYHENLIESSAQPTMVEKQLTLSQLKELEKGGVVIGNHSHTHPMFDQCTIEELEEEMDQSFAVLQNYNFKPDIFAYPNGNHSPLAEEVLRKYNVQLAFLFDHKLNEEPIDPLRISRIRVDSTTEMGEFKVKVSGLHSKVYHSLNKIKN